MAIIKKRSFFDRLAGSVPAGDDYDAFDDEAPASQRVPIGTTPATSKPSPVPRGNDDQQEGQLPVDVYQTANEIIIRAFVAGVRPEELNVSISRDMVVIEGSRESRDQVAPSDYFTEELFWGSFSRTILLPQEVDVDSSTANAKDGLLTVILPKHDKARQTKLRVKAV